MGNTTRAPAAAQPPVAITIATQPITSFDLRDSSRRQFGVLEFRGGLVLRSSFTHFGGISAIRIAPNGTNFIALSDKGWWLRGRILYDGTRPIAIADAEMAPMLGPDGRPLAARGWYDTESIAQDGGRIVCLELKFSGSAAWAFWGTPFLPGDPLHTTCPGDVA
jgi:hypothetical protein